MKNKRFLFELGSLLLIVSFSCTVHAAQSTVGLRTTNTNPVQSTDVTAKPTMQQPSPAQASSLTPCANYCDKTKGVMIEQKLTTGGCKQTAVNSCFPYTCNYQGTLCNSSCTSNAQCATPNAYCNKATNQCVAGNNCPSKCDGDNKMDYVPTSSNICIKNKTTSCFPYGCDLQSAACRNNCTSDQQCATGAMCDTEKKSCVPAYNHCDKANPNYLILVDRTKVACDPYLCKGDACLRNCDYATDCIKGYVCDTMAGRACIPIQ